MNNFMDFISQKVLSPVSENIQKVRDILGLVPDRSSLRIRIRFVSDHSFRLTPVNFNEYVIFSIFRQLYRSRKCCIEPDIYQNPFFKRTSEMTKKTAWTILLIACFLLILILYTNVISVLTSNQSAVQQYLFFAAVKPKTL